MRELTTRKWSLRAWGLLGSSVICVTRGILYLPPVANPNEALPAGIDALTKIIPAQIGNFSWQPIWLLGAVWLTVGVCGIVDIVRGIRGELVFWIMVALMLFWAFGYVGSTVLLGSRSGWAAGFIFALIAYYTYLFRRMRPALRITPDLIAGRIRVDNDIVYYLHEGEWVEVYPEVPE